jgi:hypothetical protein
MHPNTSACACKGANVQVSLTLRQQWSGQLQGFTVLHVWDLSCVFLCVAYTSEELEMLK